MKFLRFILITLFVSALCLPGAPSVHAQSGLTLSVTPSSDAKSGPAGSSVSYTLNVTLNGTTSDPVTVSASASSGNNYKVNPIGDASIVPGNSASFIVVIGIPSSAPGGDKDLTTVIFTAPGAGSSTAVLTTTVSTPPQPNPTTPPGANRPLVVLSTYYYDKDTLRVGDSFGLFLKLKNSGSMTANNMVLNFQSEGLLAQENGGVLAAGSLGSGQSKEIRQQFLVSTSLYGLSTTPLPVKLSYTDENGVAYTESFNLTVQLAVYSGSAAATPTPTQAVIVRPQIVVKSYRADVDPLQPGSTFVLEMDVENLGNADARSVTMVLGGGATSDTLNPSGTPQPGGTGGSSDLTVFAPFGSSNLVYLGDLNASRQTKATSHLIVNVSANPGAYALKLSFVYSDPKGLRQVDDQVITLLVYQLPQVEVNFYRDPGLVYAGQPNVLPLQVVNLGRKTAVLGNMTVTANGAEVQNNTSLVGPLDAGGFYTLDTTLIPPQPGPLDLVVTIRYTDDFNQPREVTQTVKLTVQEGGGGIDPSGGEGMDPGGKPVVEPAAPETFWQKTLRFVKGLLGLGSGTDQPTLTPENNLPVTPEPGGKESIPVVPKG